MGEASGGNPAAGNIQIGFEVDEALQDRAKQIMAGFLEVIDIAIGDFVPTKADEHIIEGDVTIKVPTPKIVLRNLTGETIGQVVAEIHDGTNLDDIYVRGGEHDVTDIALLTSVRKDESERGQKIGYENILDIGRWSHYTERDLEIAEERLAAIRQAMGDPELNPELARRVKERGGFDNTPPSGWWYTHLIDFSNRNKAYFDYEAEQLGGAA